MKAYKFGVDKHGEIWVSAEDMEKYTSKREELLASMQEREVAKPLQTKLQKTVEALRTPRQIMTSEQKQILHDAARNILHAQDRVA